MKKAICILLFAAVIVSAGVTYSHAVSPSARAYVLMCADTGEILLSANENDRLPMASLTKIMTAVCVTELLPLEKTFSVPADACGTEGSSVYLLPGERLSVRELLLSVMLESANDAARALAITASGSEEAFCAYMNRRAALLGLKNTCFSNPHGLDAKDHYSTAADLAALAGYALTLPQFREIVSTQTACIPYNGEPDGRKLINHNKLLSLYDGCIGVKTGFTKKSGRCLVTAAERNGVTLVCVTLNDPNDWMDHVDLLDAGFSILCRRDLVVEGEAAVIPVVSGVSDSVVCSPEPLSAVMRSDAGDVECIWEIDRFLYAPVYADQTVGRVVFRLDGKVIAVSRVFASDTVEAIKYRPDFFESFLRILLFSDR